MNDKINILYEEYESDDGIREFSVLGVSFDKKKLQAVMKDKIAKDEYGFIKEKGIEHKTAMSFATNFEDGFVGYYIIEKEVM